MQKKLLQIDAIHQKQQAQISNVQKQYDMMREVHDHLLEKRNILYTTYLTLKKDIHSRK